MSALASPLSTIAVVVVVVIIASQVMLFALYLLTCIHTHTHSLSFSYTFHFSAAAQAAIPAAKVQSADGLSSAQAAASHRPVHRWHCTADPPTVTSRRASPPVLSMHRPPKTPGRAASFAPGLINCRLPALTVYPRRSCPASNALQHDGRGTRAGCCHLWLVAATEARDALSGPTSLEPGLWKKACSQPQRIHIALQT